MFEMFLGIAYIYLRVIILTYGLYLLIYQLSIYQHEPGPSISFLYLSIYLLTSIYLD